MPAMPEMEAFRARLRSQTGEASKVVPIDKLSVVITMILAAAILREQFTPRSILGCVLIGAGTLLMVL